MISVTGALRNLSPSIPNPSAVVAIFALFSFFTEVAHSPLVFAAAEHSYVLA